MLDEHFSDYDVDGGEAPANPASDAEAHWLASVIKLRPELRTDMRNEHQGLFIVIEDPVRNKFYSVGRKEYRFLASLNGIATVEEIVKAWSGDEPIDEKAAVKICQWAVQSNLIVGDQMDATARVEKQAQAMDRQKMMAKFNPISIKFKLFNPNRLFGRLAPLFSWFFTPSFFAVWCIVGIWGLSCAVGDWERLTSASVGILSDLRWVWLLIVWAVLKVIHEMAHGLACRRYGGEVNEAGILLLLFTPMAYVNVTTSWRFPNRWHRVVVAAAGMYIELFIAFIALIVWSGSPDGVISDICYNVFFMSSITTILFNANPLMRFDGYYILADSIAITNLYTKGTKLFGDSLKSWFFGVPLTPNICSRSEFKWVATYGVLAFFWKITISLGLIIGASVLFYGLGKILAAIGIALFFCIPIWTQFTQLYGDNASVRPSSKRVALSFSLVSVVLFSLFYVIKAPATKSAAAIVQFKDETLIRAESEGFIDRINVSDGDAVTKGQTLIVLTNPQIDLEIEKLQHESEAAKVKSRKFQQEGELAMHQAEMEKLAGLRKQLAEKRAQANALRVTAPFDGFVFHRDLSSKKGSFAKLGDTLLSMAEQKTKEVVVAIEQRDWESLKGKSGNAMRVAMKSLPVFQATINRIDGRASDVPKHPSLCANAGGPLPIKSVTADSKQNQDANFLLLTPHFNVDLELSPEVSSRLMSGQRGRAFFATKSESLGQYMFVAVEQWLKEKIEMATQTATF